MYRNLGCSGKLCLHCAKGEVLLHQRYMKESWRVNVLLNPTPQFPETPIYLSWPGVRELARTSVHIWPEQAEAGGSTAVGPHCGRVLAAHEAPAKALPALPGPAQLPQTVEFPPQANILSSLFSNLPVQHRAWGEIKLQKCDLPP